MGYNSCASGFCMSDSPTPAADVAQAVKLFPRWVRDHLIATLLSIAGALGAIQTIITAFKVPQTYFLPVLFALMFLGIAFFCVWLVSDPKQSEVSTGPDASTQSPTHKTESLSLFSPNVRRLALLLLPLDIVVGGAVVIVASPRTPRPIPAIRTFVANIDSARSHLTSDATAVTLFDSYRDARIKAHGEGFWTDVDLAMAVGVANVADHNQQLQAHISEHILPPDLTTDAERAPASFAWVGNKQIESDLTLLTKHFIDADKASDQVDSFRHGTLGDYESAKQFNQRICTYWALVLGDSVPGLTEYDADGLKRAEQNVRGWLKN
jgi:hypothetical protein